MTKALIVQPDGSMTFEEFDANDYPTLRARVGGYIEMVSTPEPRVHAYINEEGKLIGLDFNPVATRLTGIAEFGDIIVGPAIFLGTDPEDSAAEGDLPRGWWVPVEHRPDCDICKQRATVSPEHPIAEAVIDGKTVFGPWANMCAEHFAVVGTRLGVGFGQWLHTV